MSDATSSYAFPVVGHGRLDYPACSYQTTNWSRISENVCLRHEISGECLVSRLVLEQKACFGCIVVMRETMYRRTFMTPNDGNLSVEQTIEIDSDYRASAPPKFSPVVVYLGDSFEIVGDESMGLDKLWHDKKFTLHKGAVIARDHWYVSKPGIGKLLRLKKDDNMPSGAMTVIALTDESGYFSVRVAADLFNGIKRAKTQGQEMCRHRDSILTHALSVGFSKLGEMEKEEISACENFQIIKQILESKNELTWEDEGFNPCRAACVYKPHSINPDIDREDRND